MTVIVGSITLERVRKYFFEDYEPNDILLPNGLCARCRKLLERVDNGLCDISMLPEAVDFN